VNFKRVESPDLWHVDCLDDATRDSKPLGVSLERKWTTLHAARRGDACLVVRWGKAAIARMEII